MLSLDSLHPESSQLYARTVYFTSKFKSKLKMSVNDEAWAQLVSTTEVDSSPIIIASDEFTIGRAQMCELSINNNKMVSGKHCKIIKDSKTMKTWLQDTSTNGTLINMKTKVNKGQKVELKHGDEIHIVFRKDATDNNVAYLFQDLAELEKEMLEETLEYDQLSDDVTQEYESIEIDNVTSKRPIIQSESSVDEPVTKKPRHEADDSKPSESPKDLSLKTKIEKLDDPSGTDKQKIDAEEIERAKDVPVKVDEKEKDSQNSAVSMATGDSDARDQMEEVLLCGICQDILHDCISLQPCMHSFCAACYSPWMTKSKECPSCRNRVMRLSRNHIVNNLVEVYLKKHPEKRRSDEEIQELKKMNKITDDMLQPKVRRRYDDYDNSDDDDDEEDEEDDDDDANNLDDSLDIPYQGLGARLINAVGGVFGLGVARPPPTICRQCPGCVTTDATTTVTTTATTIALAETAAVVVTNTPGVTATASSTTDSKNQPSTSTGMAPDDPKPSTSTDDAGTTVPAGTTRTTPDGEVIPMVEPPPFTCDVGQVHLMCLCCKQPMPDRRTAAVTDPTIPTQQCDICFRGYCHMYWGCKRVDCYGCLNYFRDFTFGKKCLISIINENHYESDIFKNYMNENNITVKDLLKQCLVKLDSGEYVCPDAHSFLGRKGSDVRICYPCAIRNFKELAYQYRRDIAFKDLPTSVTSRPNCYWGKNCRTQRSRPHHAARFNHICDQSRK